MIPKLLLKDHFVVISFSKMAFAYCSMGCDEKSETKSTLKIRR